MAALTEAGLLAVWEAGSGHGGVRRALVLAASGGANPSTVADLSIGRRAEFVLALRERCFGSVLPSVVTCPGCAEELELELTVDDVRAAEPQSERRVLVDGVDVEFRPITSRDLLEVGPHEPDARRRLLSRCVVGATRDGREIDVGALGDPVLDALAEALSTCDPQADVLLELDCAACGHEWSSPFDITAYLWGEMDVYVRRLVHDVHLLASAYGWSEAEVLAVSPARRRFYLEMAS
ncbi:MAG: hypothetical protein JWQ81_3467 [Amycolatopsis sp.]|jgi:hypothetical protein|uniref:T4 family baseplate hub assembly chaperone n=1 Tax=Amycolatopsis sp. TaxID=37632 RepID=UPI002608DC31|nr:hypothetical protein [Amycolatopsis sp.]MCU1682728.1 hypothetical protein [Amycolatopsis sp.]